MSRTIRADLTRFSSATGLGTVHGAAAQGLRPGDVVLVADEDSDVLQAEVVAVRSGAADLRVFWDRPVGRDAAAPVVRLELSPIARDLGVTEVTDADIEAGQQLRVGDRLELVDEGGHHIAAVVTATEPERYGGLRYRVRFPV